MPIYAQTLIIEGLGHGYSETYYFRFESNNTNLAAAFVAEHRTKRAALLGKQHIIKGERVAKKYSDTMLPIKRQTVIKKYFIQGNQSQNSEESNISLQVLWTAANGLHKKLLFMSGPYRSIFPEGDSFDPGQGGNFTTNFNAWRAYVTLKGMGWIASIPSAPTQISGYTFNPANGRTTYTVSNDLFGPVFDGEPVKIRVEFPTIRSALDGVQLVIPLTATTAITAKPRPSQPFTVPGKMVVFSKEFVSIAEPAGEAQSGTIEPQNPMSRKRGRPLLVSRGRLANQVRW